MNPIVLGILNLLIYFIIAISIAFPIIKSISFTEINYILLRLILSVASDILTEDIENPFSRKHIFRPADS